MGNVLQRARISQKGLIWIYSLSFYCLTLRLSKHIPNISHFSFLPYMGGVCKYYYSPLHAPTSISMLSSILSAMFVMTYWNLFTKPLSVPYSNLSYRPISIKITRSKEEKSNQSIVIKRGENQTIKMYRCLINVTLSFLSPFPTLACFWPGLAQCHCHVKPRLDCFLDRESISVCLCHSLHIFWALRNKN